MKKGAKSVTIKKRLFLSNILMIIIPAFLSVLALAAGTAACYLLGTVWYVAVTGNPWGASLAACVLPFLPGDAVKIAAAVLAGTRIRKAVFRRS